MPQAEMDCRLLLKPGQQQLHQRLVIKDPTNRPSTTVGRGQVLRAEPHQRPHKLILEAQLVKRNQMGQKVVP